MHPEQAISALRFDPLIPVWAIIALAVIAALIVAVAVFRRARMSFKACSASAPWRHPFALHSARYFW